MQFVGSSPVPLDSPTALRPASDSTSFGLTFGTPSDTCTDIATCRTRYTIVWSSLVTILACVWTAVHRNVPAPEKARESRYRRIMGVVLEAAKIVVVTVLVPEWVLAWAVRQYLNSRDVGETLEKVRVDAEEIWDAKQEKLREMMADLGERDARGQYMAATSSEGHDEELAIIQESTVAVNKQTGRLSGKWMLRHGFFVIMGGFHYYKDGEPQHPLPRSDVIELVSRGELVPPTDEEIRNWSQSDVFSKVLAVIQTLWFVIQAIARRIEGLPVTQLEIMTLAYTTISIAMYVAWWNKPQNVSGPVRVVVQELPEPAARPGFEGLRVFDVIAGWQDDNVDLRKERCVPTFYGGAVVLDKNSLYADGVALAAAMVFGAVHCAAWYYAFPSHVEKLIWRVSSVIVVAVPGAMLAVFLPLLMVSDIDNLGDEHALLTSVVFFPSAPLYVVARLLLLSLSFSTLRSLPPEAYHAVKWTFKIPHFT
ncbi:hypothetical protein BV25DRAFT_1918233 [Artomyces pyxidatus]|uniref:Uncharacterized protein n=1 Tax=Artomyces pyxidatus TaxID=48021 RepID=A0ACB8SUR9_9AGAM|nr:hypothetical protein BV25DRAFT_1918233 [Artomyces pyxidatus]